MTVEPVTLPADARRLGELSADALDRLQAARAEILECERILARTDDNVVGAVLRHQGVFTEWNHYPKGDAFDPTSLSQYYYHAHARAERVPGEHGHFHTFLRTVGFPRRTHPADALPSSRTDMNAASDAALCHLIGLSMDKRGKLIRLFTTNRWVTGETWYGAADVIALLDRFEVDHARPSWPTDRWLTAIVRLFAPQIADLVKARDAVVANHQRRHPDHDTFEDRGLNVTSEMTITVPRQCEFLDRALAGRGG